MLQRRKINVLLIMLIVLLFSSILTACGSSSEHLLSPDEIAQYVGAHYGDPHPQITGVLSTVTDPPPHDPMYVMSLTGDFHKGTLEAHSLGFSATANRMYVWAITARDQAGNQIWLDHELDSVTPTSSS